MDIIENQNTKNENQIENKVEIPLKRSKTGLETEFHLINNKGEICNNAKEIIDELHQNYKRVDVTKEIGKNMIEFGCYPEVLEFNPTLHLVDSIGKAVDICKKKEMLFYPFSTYPGKFQPEFSEGSSMYEIKKKIFGFPRIEHSCRVVGFHHHYSLPKGVFDAQNKILKLMLKSKLERSMIGSYNFEIAVDPALTLIMQSSPFYQGFNFAKCCRVLIYRGGRKLKYMDGLYAKLQQIGGLPPYKMTVTDLLSSFQRRIKRWKKEVKKADPNANFEELYPFKLDIGWHPIKINKHGTLEERGMDINFMSNVVATTVLLKFCLKKIQREFIEIVPADFAIKESFKIENNIMYIPPHTFVRNTLQMHSAYSGYNNKMIYNHVKRFLNFAKSVTPKRYNKIIRPILDMVENKQSMSDKILLYAKRKGFYDNGKISDEDALELALHYAERFPKDLEKTKENLYKVAQL